MKLQRQVTMRALMGPRDGQEQSPWPPQLKGLLFI